MNCSSIWIATVFILSFTPPQQLVQFSPADVRVEWNQDAGVVSLPFQIAQGLHIQAIEDTQDNVIPTEIIFDDNLFLDIENYRFSIQQYDSVLLDTIPHRVISGKFEVVVSVRMTNKTNRAMALKGKLAYQACNDRQCFFPRSLTFEVPLYHAD